MQFADGVEWNPARDAAASVQATTEEPVKTVDPEPGAFAAFALLDREPVDWVRDGRQLSPVMEGRAIDVAHELAHQLTPEAYREQFRLKPDYLMAAPGYSRQRSEMAKRVGLGQRVQAPSGHRQPRSGA